ncbi:hypothetical protein [Streptomyces chilikensis]|uniref:hypothetical protein n=1 Tax=Streptomyces chilikensis TaxID=1194079 RepID=UPI0014083ACD|nr:hypothetical protein [Streptomyces chilikensis]
MRDTGHPAGDYARLDRVLPLLLDAAARSTERGPAGAARAADVWVITADAVEVEARGRHPAGIGLRVTTDAGYAPHHMALRLVQDEQGVWLVDQAISLEESTGTKAVRAPLART